MKKYVIGFILGAIIFSGMGVIAYNYNANDISYTPSDASWDVNDVESAINDLHQNSSNSNISALIPTLTANNSNIIKNYNPYEAGDFYGLFDDNDSTIHAALTGTSTANSYVGYMFDDFKYVDHVLYYYYINSSAINTTSYTYKLQYYDGENWIDSNAKNYTYKLTDTNCYIKEIYILNKRCKGIRIYFTGGSPYLHISGQYATHMQTLQAYGS